jgi:hypothetical protein
MARLIFCISMLLCLPGVLPAAAPADSDKEIQALTQERAKTSERFESVDKSVTHLEAGVVIMLGVVTLVVTMLFGTIIFGEYRVNQAVADLENKAKEVRERFPMLAAMEAQAHRALSDVEVMFGPEEWKEDRYASLGIPERQRILTVEHLIALEFAGPATAPQLRGMANFYSSKYTVEGLKSDLDRALYYALRAADRGEHRFQYLNDIGLVYTDLAETDRQHRTQHVSEGIGALEKSSRKQPAQQRSYYNLSVILFGQALQAKNDGQTTDSQTLFQKIRDLLNTALSHPKWEVGISPESTSLVHYNLSCCLCRLAEFHPGSNNSQTPLLDEACTHLEQASRFKETKSHTLEHDLNGDLYLIGSNPHYAQRITDIVANFERSWGS